jgi:polysaccharide biosynthesis protein PslJ
MTRVSTNSTTLPPPPDLELPRTARRLDVVSLLTLYVFLLLAIPSALVFGPLGGAGGPATILALGFMLWYLAMRLHPASGVARGHQPIRAAGVLFFCSILAAYISANRHLLPTSQQNGADLGVVSAVGWLAVLMLAADGICAMDRLEALLDRIVIGATGMAALGITEFFTGFNAVKYIIIPGLTEQLTPTDLETRGGLNRPSATAAHPLEFAAVLAMSFPLALHRARFVSSGSRRRRWLPVILIAAAIPTTISRAAVLELLAIGIVLLPTWSKRERRYVYAVTACSITLMFVLIPKLLAAFATILEQIYTGSSSTESRTSAIAAALHLVPQHPWLGVGFQTFSPLVYFYTDDQYVLSSIETGLVGLAALSALFITGWLTARSLRRRVCDPETRDLAQCLAAAVAAAAVSFSTFDALSFKMAAGLTFLLLGCVGAAWRLLRDTATERQASPHRGQLGHADNPSFRTHGQGLIGSAEQ